MARILVVDDDADVRAVIELTLTRAGHSVMAERGAAAALRRLGLTGSQDGWRADLAILDRAMPGRDGLSLAARLSLDRRTREMPVLLLSGHRAGTPPAGAPPNVFGGLRKPFGPGELIRAVSRALAADGPTRWYAARFGFACRRR